MIRKKCSFKAFLIGCTHLVSHLPPPQALREHFGQVRKMRVTGESLQPFNAFRELWTCLGENIVPRVSTSLPPATRSNSTRCVARARKKGRGTPDAIRQRGAIFRFPLSDNFDPGLSFPNII